MCSQLITREDIISALAAKYPFRQALQQNEELIRMIEDRANDAWRELSKHSWHFFYANESPMGAMTYIGIGKDKNGEWYYERHMHFKPENDLKRSFPQSDLKKEIICAVLEVLTLFGPLRTPFG